MRTEAEILETRAESGEDVAEQSDFWVRQIIAAMEQCARRSRVIPAE